MVVFDATFLLLLVDPSASPPLDPATGQPVEKARERIEYLLNELQKSGERVVIPTPALAEALVGATGPIGELVTLLTASYKLKTAPFDELAAIEVALMADKSAGSGGAVTDETKAKVKYDRQIIAIAKVVQADAIYSDDKALRAKAKSVGLRAIGVEELDLPPVDPQQNLSLPEPPPEALDDEQGLDKEA